MSNEELLSLMMKRRYTLITVRSPLPHLERLELTLIDSLKVPWELVIYDAANGKKFSVKGNADKMLAEMKRLEILP